MEYLAIVYLTNLFSLILINLFTLFLTNLFLEHVFLLERHSIYFFCNTFLFSLLISSVSLVDLVNGTQVGFFVYSIILVIQFISGYLLIRTFYPMINYAQNLFIQTISEAILAVFRYIVLNFSFGYIQSLSRLATMFVGISLCFFQVGIAIIVCYAARRSQTVSTIKRIFDYPVFMLMFTGLFFLSELFVYSRFFLNNSDRQVHSWLLSLIYLIVLIIFGLWTLTIDQKKKWENTQLMLIQQQNYLKQMEEVQRKIRSVHHDYKNMLTGIYLHASQGNTKEIQTFLSNKFFQLDHQIEEKLKRQNQLLLIENTEIKGLLISKLAEAESKGISIHLEITDIFKNFPMESSDLVRVMGIFLDNAIEAVLELNRTMQKIVIVIMQDEKSFVIRIKNPNGHKVALHELVQTNFSTKGKNRGFGLTNVRKILARYPHILNEVNIQNDQFIQTLTIKKE